MGVLTLCRDNRLKKYLFIFVLCLGILSTAFRGLGEYLDITVEPRKADIIVYLGGGGFERMEKTMDLYRLGYSKTGKIIFTASATLYINRRYVIRKKNYFIEQGIPKENIVHAKKTKNTMEEVLFVKNYMLEHGLKSVIFISDPPHSRRIIFLAQSIADYKGNGLSCSVVGSDVKWWSKKNYYRSTKALTMVVSELIKLPYNYFVYKVLKDW
jgi:uncharacterized SAM-binding protein YcdF (DUF218 family)